MKRFIALSALAAVAVAPRKNKQCKALNVFNGEVDITECKRTPIGGSCTYSCSNGDTRTAVCEAKDQWTATEACPTPEEPITPEEPAPGPTGPDADCGALTFDTGAGATTVCTATASGSDCSFACLSGESRTTTCTDSVWRSVAACPASCGALTFNTGQADATVCTGTNSGASCSFSCDSGDALTASCDNGVWSASGACPAAVACGANNPLFLESQALNTVAATAGVSQDRPETGRFRVEWQADTAPVVATPGTLAASRLPREVGQFELMAECCLDQAATLPELPIQFVSGSATFRYNKDTINWEFGPLFNPIYLTPPDSEPGIVIQGNAEGTAILQLIWVEKFVPAEGAPGPVRVRVQGEDLAAFPKGWPQDTSISVSAVFNIKVAGSDTIYTYTTESGAFDYGGEGAGAATTNLVAGVALGVFGLAGAAFAIRKRLVTRIAMADSEALAEEGEMEELPDLEATDFATTDFSTTDEIEESDFIFTS